MSKKSALSIAAIFVLTVALTLAYSCWWSPGAKIKATVEGASRALEKRDVVRMLEFISEDFDHQGRDKKTISQDLKFFYEEFDRVTITLGEHRISVAGDTAWDSIKVVVVVSRQGEQGYLLGQFGNPAPLAVRLKKRGRWLITGVDGMPGY